MKAYAHLSYQVSQTSCICLQLIVSSSKLIKKTLETQDRFDWNLNYNNCLSKLRETQSNDMRQGGGIKANISLFHHTVLVGRSFQSWFQLIPCPSGLPWTLPGLRSSLRSSSFHHLETWVCFLPLAIPVLTPGFQLCLLPLTSPPWHGLDNESFLPIAQQLFREGLGPSPVNSVA